MRWLLLILAGLWATLGANVWFGVAPVYALPAGDAITNSRTLLRLATPISNENLRQLDRDLTSIEADLKYNRWSPVQGDIQRAQRWIERQRGAVIATLPTSDQEPVEQLFQHLQATLTDMSAQVALHIKGKDAATADYDAALTDLEAIESYFIDPQQFVQIPPEYAHLPVLTGRAQVALKTSAGEMVVTLDGYNAPLTAGNFADLVQRGFYDGIEFNRVEDFYVIQAGDPPGPAEGFLDPKTKQLRTIPLEIRIREQPQPIYGKTLEEAGFWDADPILPFSARGTVAMARGEDPNSASSQFFIFLAEPDLTPAGLNLIDGRYAVFGYITQGIETLDKLKLGDRIISAKLIAGQEHLHT